jgi:hypothetical protein
LLNIYYSQVIHMHPTVPPGEEGHRLVSRSSVSKQKVRETP